MHHLTTFISNALQVADFGMSRDLAYEEYYISHGGHIPVKWTAPEVRLSECIHDPLPIMYTCMSVSIGY